MSLYNDLDASPDADADTITALYRAAAMKHHPDRGGKVEDFQRIKKAYEILSDPDRRKRYDETGDAGDVKANNETLSQMVQAFLETVGSPTFDERYDDPFVMIRNHVTQGKEGITAIIKNLEATNEKRRSVIKRMNPKDDNVFIEALESDIRARLMQIDEHRKKMGECDHWLSMLEGHSYAAEARPQQRFNNPLQGLAQFQYTDAFQQAENPWGNR